MDRFLIAPLEVGLEKDLKPWLIPDTAYAELTNSYIFRGRIRKRFGSKWMADDNLNSRLGIPLAGGAGVGITDGAGNAVGTVPGSKFKVGQQFSIDTEVFTVITAGIAQPMITTGTSTVYTFNTVNGAYVINGATPGTQVYFYPAEPVMGITNYETGAINNQPSYAFDTQFAYTFSTGFWQRSGTSVWHGDNLDFFWATNWNGLTVNTTYMFVSNFQVTNYNGAVAATDDPIRTFNTTAGWADFNPIFKVAGDYISTAKIILPFKDRLILLNTVETDAAGVTNSHYAQRCRFSWNGSPLSANAWLEPNEVGAGGAGWIDAATEEDIISAKFIKDRLIVFFERSTWELAYTGNQVLPFVWQKINTELGSEAEFSSVPFDKIILTVGSTGIHACNGANVERIDNKIPDEIFNIKNKDEGVKRIAGIRDYYTEMVYWTFPKNVTATYPNKVLVYNYKNGSWAFNDDCMTAWGYFEQQSDTTWASVETDWLSAGFTWSSGIVSAQFRQVIAGNQQGYVFIVNPDLLKNAPVMQITNMAFNVVTNILTLTIIDHTLTEGEYIKISDSVGVVIGGAGIYAINSIVDADTITVKVPSFAGVYAGSGLVARVSNPKILSKQWNFYLQEGKNAAISKMLFCVQKTTNGQITVDSYPSSSQISLRDGGIATGTILGSSVLDTTPYTTLFPLEEFQERLWHPVYLQADGQGVQISISMTNDQITTPAIAESDFQLEGIIIYATRTSDNLQ
jgi:hypothetical protein